MRVVFLAAAAAACSSAAAADSPFYVSASGGGYFRQSDSTDANFFHAATPTVTVPGTVGRDYDPGFVVDLAAGYHLTQHIRLEAELGYTSYSGKTLAPFTAQPGFPQLNGQTFSHVSGDDFSRVTGTLNGFYDFSPIAGVSPYVGAGIGEARNHQSSGMFQASDGATFGNLGGNATHGLALLEAGVSIPLTHNLSLVPAYRYVRYFAGDQDAAHVVKVGLRYRF
jgi:opacity protein-like surface antigen